MPAFSIIVPAYNAEKQIEGSLRSVLAQTLQDFEVVVVDDGSVDSTGAILERFAKLDPRIHVIRQTNQGPLLARQNGISAATGQYILSLDSDDYFDPDLLETVNRYSRQGYDIIEFRWHHRKRRNHCRDSKKLFAHEEIFAGAGKKKLYDKVIRTNDLNMMWSKAVKRDLFSSQRFDPEKYRGFRQGEDLVQAIPLYLNAEKIIYLDIPLYNYVRSEESITGTLAVAFERPRELVREALNELVRQSGLDIEECTDSLDRRLLWGVADKLPTPAQLKKEGASTVEAYLQRRAQDELFRGIYERRGTQGIRIAERVKLFLLFHYRFRWLKAFLWVHRPLVSLKVQVRSLWAPRGMEWK